jgi:hypothetical protein
MNKAHCISLAAAGLAAVGPAIGQQFLVVPNSAAATRAIMQFSPVDGALINSSFIPGTGASYAMSTPKDALQVGNELWVADQVANSIFRFDLAGAYLSTISGDLSNIRGMEYFNGHVYVSDAGASGATAANSVVKYTAAGARVASWIVGNSPFDVLAHNGELLVSHFTSNVPDITRWTENGVLIGTFHEGAIALPEQMSHKPDNHVLVAGFSTTAGLYEYDAAGAQVGFIAASGPRGVYPLANGNILWTGGAAVNLYNITTQSSSAVFATTGGQYINLVVVPSACYANCDGSTASPVLNVADFTCYLQKFSAGAAYANCDESTATPVLNVQDFTCFLQKYSAGCP